MYYVNPNEVLKLFTAYTEEYGDTLPRDKAIEELQDSLDNAESEWKGAYADRPQGWIPTSVRMPSENGKYLCCWQGKSIETGMFLNGHFRLYGEIKDRLVTAWMPLPKPMKGADDEHILK